MYVIISGANRVEFCNVERKKDFDRWFFMTRGQLYFIPTNGMTKLIITEYGKKRPSEACIIYSENSIYPYDEKGIKYNMDHLLEDIDRYKRMTDFSMFSNKKLWMENLPQKAWKFFTAPMGIAALILIYVIIAGGFF